MASIHREIVMDANPDDVWDALRDFDAVHRRLAPGFLVDARPDGIDRIVTFFNGAIARERLVTLDDGQRRLVWSVTESSAGLTHHNASAQVFPADDGSRTRFVWIADLLPDEAAPRIAALIERAIDTVKQTMERTSPGV